MLTHARPALFDNLKGLPRQILLVSLDDLTCKRNHISSLPRCRWSSVPLFPITNCKDPQSHLRRHHSQCLFERHIQIPVLLKLQKWFADIMGHLELQLRTQSRLVLLFDRDKNRVPLNMVESGHRKTNKFGRTFAISWTQRCCSYQLVTILWAVKNVVTAILSTTEKCEIFHRSQEQTKFGPGSKDRRNRLLVSTNRITTSRNAHNRGR